MKTLAQTLERWFAVHKRPMPWRKKVTPYASYLSEIMMQQTTYASVLPYYERFLKRFPTIEKLAAADLADVLKAWEGLGYYARARNLHRAAKEIAANKAWPKSAAEWAKVPGVGPYTAAALSSVLNGERTSVVDGNVARVFARYWMLADDFHKLPARNKLAARLDQEIAAAKVPGDFNQAMMELGALVCTPTNPNCEACPLKEKCAAKEKDVIADFPAKAKKKELPRRSAHVVILADQKGRILLVQNKEGGLLKGLWELPSVEGAGEHHQTFSHFHLDWKVSRGKRTDATFQDPRKVPLTTATKKVLAAAGLLA